MNPENLDTIIVMGGGLKKTANGWRSTYFNEGDCFGATGDNIRVLAAAIIYLKAKKNGNNILLIPSGSKGQYKNIVKIPAVSSVLKKELQNLGVSKKDILEDDQSGSTFQTLLFINKLILKNKFGRIGILSNQYHLPRIRAFLEYAPQLQLKNRVVSLISAEQILIKYEPRLWKTKIVTAYRNSAFKKRMAMEKKGVLEIKKGIYEFK